MHVVKQAVGCDVPPKGVNKRGTKRPFHVHIIYKTSKRVPRAGHAAKVMDGRTINDISTSTSYDIVAFIPFDFIPNGAPIAINVSHIADDRVRSPRVPSALQCQVGPTQHHASYSSCNVSRPDSVQCAADSDGPLRILGRC